MSHYEHSIELLSDLTEYESNARTHSEEQIQQIMVSIQTFGFTNPILIDENKRIIAGHGRASASARLGLKEVPCIAVTGLNQQQISALVIADNKLAENAGWDFDALSSELSFLQDAGFDMAVTGFTDYEIDTILSASDDDEPFVADISSIIQYNIIFEDESQQQAWFAMVKDLKSQYNEAQTLGEAILKSAEDKGLV